jgi:hypothetical protein
MRMHAAGRTGPCLEYPARGVLMADRAHALSALQRSVGNQAAQRLLTGDLVVQRYRPKTATHFGAANTSALIESTFKSQKTQPWLSLITVEFDSVVADSSGVDMPKGIATATYFSNAAALPSFSVEVTGGPRGLRSDPGNFTVGRIEGVGYNDPTGAAAIAATQGEGALEGPKRGAHRRYTKPTAGQTPMNVGASMHLAVFYNAGEGLHFAPPDVASHGCVHVVDFGLLTQLNYHSVIGLTKVKVIYTGAAKAAFAP